MIMKQKQLAILVAVSLLFAMMPTLSFAQTYEGEKDKKGLPDGEGTMYFESSSILKGKTVDYLEKLTGKFKKGYPVEGKSYRYLKSDGRLAMEFSGKFKVRNKGVLNKLSDLDVYGYVTYYNREENDNYDKYGYHIIRGWHDNGKITHGEYIITKTSQVGGINNGNVNGFGSIEDWLPSKIKKDFSPIFLEYYYYRAKEDNSVLFKDLKSANANIIGPLGSGLSKYVVLWSGNVVDGMIDGNGYGIAYKDDRITSDKNLFYIKGDFKRGIPVSTYTYKTLDRSECSIYEVKIDNNNGLYNYNVKEEKRKYSEEYGLFFEHNGQWKTHMISEAPIIRKMKPDVTIKPVTSFKDGFANVDFIYTRNFFNCSLQYKIDENGQYKGLTPKCDEVILSYIDSINTIYKTYSKMFNPTDLKTLKKSFKKYGCDIHELRDIFARYHAIYDLLKSDIGADTKAKLEGFNNKKEAAYKMHWIYNRILWEAHDYEGYTRDMIDDEYKYLKESKVYLVEYVDDLLNQSYIKQDAAQVAKDLIIKSIETFQTNLKSEIKRQHGAASANYEAKRLKTSKIASHRCKEPSGRLVTGFFDLFGDNYQHINKGTICFEDGITASYNISYGSNKNFKCYVITYYEFSKNLRRTSYKSYDEMVTDLINSRK